MALALQALQLAGRRKSHVQDGVRLLTRYLATTTSTQFQATDRRHNLNPFNGIHGNTNGVFLGHATVLRRFESTKTKVEKQPEESKELKGEEPKTMAQKMKQAVTEYGSTVVVFHVTISLMSLGTCYVLVTSGLDVNALMTPMGISDETVKKIAAGAGTFAIAYAVHKVFAPVRIIITLTATPFIVRYLRHIGVLKIKK